MKLCWTVSIGWLMTAVAAAQAPSVLLMAEEPHRSTWSEALAVELAPRAHAVVPMEAPIGATQLERSAFAQRTARERGARAAIWVEPAGVMWKLCAVGPEDASVREAPLPSPIDARTVALVAASLIEELLEPMPDGPELIIEAESEAPVSLRVRLRGPPTPEVEEPAEDHRSGAVLAQEGREVLVELGERDGLRQRSGIELYGDDDGAEELALAEIVDLGRETSTARLLDGFPLPAAPLRSARARGAALPLRAFHVPRPTGAWIDSHIALALVLPTNVDTGAGVLAAARAGYRLPFGPFAVAVDLAPLLLLGANDVLTGAYSAALHIELDERWFGIGVLAGASSYHVRQEQHDVASSAPQIAMGWSVRLGPRDGSRVELRGGLTLMTDIEVDGDAQTGVRAGAFTLDAQLAIVRGVWLALFGGGGTHGAIYGHLGPRFLVVGDLGTGSVIVTPTASVAYALDNVGGRLVGGLGLGIGVEVRP